LSLLIVFFEPLQELVSVVRLIVLHDVLWVVTINLVDVFSELAARLCFDLLDLLEAAALDECALGFEVLWQYLCKLGTDVGKDVVRSQAKEWFKGWDMGAHLNNILQSLL